MKLDSFFSAALLGFVLSLVAAAVMSVSIVWLAPLTAFTLLLSAISLLYLVLLLRANPVPFGLSLHLLSWLLVSVLLLSFSVSAISVVLGFAMLNWLQRCVVRYHTGWQALLDGAVSVLALCCAAAVFLYSNSLFLGFWCGFLTLAFAFFIPGKLRTQSASLPPESAFDQARYSAEQALRRMHNHSAY